MEYFETMSLEIIVGLIAITIALRSFRLQREEVKRSGRVAVLVQASNIVQQEIDWHERFITNLKSEGGSYKPLADRVNKTLRPLKTKIDEEFLVLMGVYRGGSLIPELEQLISDAEKHNVEYPD